MNVLITGGAGYIGSHAARLLLREGHGVVVYDDLSKGHHQAVAAAGNGLPQQARFVMSSLKDRAVLRRVLRDHAIEAVLHFAAFAEVGESVREPARYYDNNVVGALSVLDTIREAGVSKFVFSSTAAVYGNPVAIPITETQLCAPINPYGRSKLMVEMMLEDYARAYGLGHAILRYFNVAGADPEGNLGESHDPESHLIPRVLAATAQGEPVSIFGDDYPTPDGTCIRDYIHVEDLVSAHVLALQNIQPGRGDIYNLGSESGFSVKQVIETCSRVTGRKVVTRVAPRRPGDPPILVASSAKIREKLGWQRKYPDLQTIVEHAWNWHRANERRFVSAA